MILTGLMCGVLLFSNATATQTVTAPNLDREVSFSTRADWQIVPSPKPKPSSSVTVKAGDNDVKIAKRLGMSAVALRKANPGVNWTKIKPGQKLKVSATKPATAAKKPTVAKKSVAKKPTASKPVAKATSSTGSKNHIVKGGENDWIIARVYGVTPSVLAKLNPKTNWTKLRPGDTVKVPAPKMVAAKASTSTKITTKRVRVIADAVFVRSGPNTSAKALTKVTKDRVASVVDRAGDWYKIKFEGGTVGWVRNDLLKPVSAQEASKLLAMAKRNAAKAPTRVASNSRSNPRASKPPMRVASNSSYVSGSIIDTAKSNLGIRYSWGGTSRGGFDCSGFVGWVYARHGVKLPRTSIQQSSYGNAVAKDDLEKGDLVFFKTTRSNRVSHVGMYIGGGKFIHASSGTGRVTISGLGEGYYQKRYAGARRVTGAKGSAKLDDYREEERDQINSAQKKSDAVVKKVQAETEKKKIEEAAKAAEQASKEAPAKVTVGADVISK